LFLEQVILKKCGALHAASSRSSSSCFITCQTLSFHLAIIWQERIYKSITKQGLAHACVIVFLFAAKGATKEYSLFVFEKQKIGPV